MWNDKILIWRFNRGDASALHRIYQRYKNDLISLAAALLGDLNLAEDVVHNVFLAFAQKVGSFRLTGSLKSYLAACVANEARNIIRRRKYLDAMDVDEVSHDTWTDWGEDGRSWFSVDERQDIARGLERYGPPGA